MTEERIRPISPDEAGKQKLRTLPNEVLESFNELIAQNFSGGSASVLQKDIVGLMVRKGLKRSQIFDNGWLDVEEIYREAGWKVDYDKPGYNESYEPSFTFSRRKKNLEDW